MPARAHGAFKLEAFGSTLAALLPEGAVVAEDAVTSGRALFPPTWRAAPHDWIQITGGAIGHALPAATGAGIACPDRRVVCLQADGAGMYSLQALWTQARENLDIVNVVFANRRYAILTTSWVTGLLALLLGAYWRHAEQGKADEAREHQGEGGSERVHGLTHLSPRTPRHRTGPRRWDRPCPQIGRAHV